MPSVLDRDVARRIKAVGLDVDGVLTDGGVYIGLVAHTPIEFKRFNIQDGLGVKLLRAAGLPVILVSGRPSEASEARAAELQVDELLQVAPDTKLAALEQALERRGIALDACAFVGDDLADVPVLRAVGLPIAVANATPEVKAAARFVTSVSGGHGAVRQVAELLLQARGDWSALVERYLEASDVARPADRSR
jgi:3-deoxy-D-manno-octulosonate 8-phosphate phosphatase (KDO 8-P phosphatase)